MNSGALDMAEMGFSLLPDCRAGSFGAKISPTGERAAMLLDEPGKDAPDEAAKAAGDALVAQAAECANFLKALGHDGRLMILCHLLSGPKSVTALENLLDARQAVVSQQLARLRFEGLVQARRDGQTIYYSILDPKVSDLLRVLADMFKKPT
jgi:DNA-binding transcriptional ArsR family regulator